MQHLPAGDGVATRNDDRRLASGLQPLHHFLVVRRVEPGWVDKHHRPAHLLGQAAEALHVMPVAMRRHSPRRLVVAARPQKRHHGKPPAGVATAVDEQRLVVVWLDEHRRAAVERQHRHFELTTLGQALHREQDKSQSDQRQSPKALSFQHQRHRPQSQRNHISQHQPSGRRSYVLMPKRQCCRRFAQPHHQTHPQPGAVGEQLRS